MEGNEIVITEEMVHTFNKKQMPSILRYDTSGNLLGNSIDRTGNSPFQQLSEEEKEARINNYIEKNKGRIFNRDENELRKRCEQEYNSQASGENKYMLDERMKESLRSSGRSELVKDAAALCQLTYACDPNRAGDNLYHTASKNWIPYLTEQSKEFLSTRMNDLFEGIKWSQPNLLVSTNTYSLSQKINFEDVEQ